MSKALINANFRNLYPRDIDPSGHGEAVCERCCPCAVHHVSEVSPGATDLIITLTIKVLFINNDNVNKVHIVFSLQHGIDYAWIL